MEINRCITFKDMMCKEVINICNGKKLGNIFNAELDIQCNKILAYLVKEKRIDVFRKEQIYRIPIKDIKKIGKEIILVEIKTHNKECFNNCDDNHSHRCDISNHNDYDCYQTFNNDKKKERCLKK